MKTLFRSFVAIAAVAISLRAAPPPSVGPNLAPKVSIPPTVSAPTPPASLAVVPPSAPMSFLEMPNLTDRAYRDLSEALEPAPPLPGRALFSRNLTDTLQVRAIGAPLNPVPGETRPGSEQVRVPLLQLAW